MTLSVHQHPETANPSSPASVTTGCFDKENVYSITGVCTANGADDPPAGKTRTRAAFLSSSPKIPTNSHREHASIGLRAAP